MPVLIEEDQTCGVKGICIHDNLFILQNVTDYANIYNKDVAIISIDQEKAFDRIEWVFLHAILDKMGIPNALKQWFKIIYTQLMVTINVNNLFTVPFIATRDKARMFFVSHFIFNLC